VSLQIHAHWVLSFKTARTATPEVVAGIVGSMAFMQTWYVSKDLLEDDEEAAGERSVSFRVSGDFLMRLLLIRSLIRIWIESP
jgi:hypothetical protein